MSHSKCLTRPSSFDLGKRGVFKASALGLLLVLLFCSPAKTLDLPPVNGPLPHQVYIDVFVFDVDSIDSAKQNFTANIFYRMRWNDPDLAHSGNAPVVRSLDKVWNPGLQIINEQFLRRTFADVVKIHPDGTVVYRQRVWGSFSQPMDLREFPFDTQSFTVQFVAIDFLEKELKFIQDPEIQSGIASKLSLADWRVTETEAGPLAYEPVPGESSQPGFHLTFDAQRHTGYYISKIILPLLLIVAMSWIVFWIDPSEAGTQVSVAITTMLTLIAYRFAIGNDIPRVSYLTRLDDFILISTLLVFATLVEVIVTATMARGGHIKKARVVDLWARWIVPLGYGCAAGASFL
jgi:hypothetical protein